MNAIALAPLVLYRTMCFISPKHIPPDRTTPPKHPEDRRLEGSSVMLLRLAHDALLALVITAGGGREAQ